MRPDFQKQELIPAIVQDYRSGEVLMQAYVNEEAYEYMLKNKETCFYSRSRKELWHKGETSGHIQLIKGMYLDCDKDSLLIFAEQIGNSCHTGKYSCFFNEVMPYKYEGATCTDAGTSDMQSDSIFKSLYELIEEREANPKEKSYTNYLLNEGIDKICKKIGEEASETIIAAKNNDKEGLIAEISDLMYHIFVLMFNEGVTLQEIVGELSKRNLIQGNKKEANQKGEI